MPNIVFRLSSRLKLFTNSYINLEKAYSDANHIEKHLELGGALRREKLIFQGTQHRGIDDAENIARLLPNILQNMGSLS